MVDRKGDLYISPKNHTRKKCIGITIQAQYQYPHKVSKMLPPSQILATVAVVAATADAAFGPAFSTGPVASNSFIRESTATLILPNTPSSSTGLMSLWVGMGTSNGDLIQSIADNDQSLPGNPQQSQWGVFAYTLVKTGGK